MNIKNIERYSKVLDFITRNKTNESYAFSLNELKEGTKLHDLTSEELSKMKDIIIYNVKGTEWYTFESFKIITEKYQNALDELVKRGHVEIVTCTDGTVRYKATSKHN